MKGESVSVRERRRNFVLKLSHRLKLDDLVETKDYRLSSMFLLNLAQSSKAGQAKIKKQYDAGFKKLARLYDVFNT
jgi:hypothetical protein